MKKLLRSMSLCMTLLLIFQLLIPFYALAEGASAPSLSMNSDGNYTVSSVEDLNTMRSDINQGINYAGKTIVLTQDIDLSQSEVPLNSFTTQNTFSGCFDGNSHTISGYTDAKSGLFSLIDSNSYVRNLRISANVVLNDAGSIINSVYSDSRLKTYGLIANESAGTINCCSTTGNLTADAPCTVGGIAGNSVLYAQVDGINTIIKGKLTNCFSNVIFNNQTIDEGDYSVYFSGMCYYAGDIIEHCYFYGQFTGNTLPKGQKLQIKWVGGSAKTCAYDSQMAVGCYGTGSAMGVKYTTAKMKEQASYTALGFDFNECWSIDSVINDGYPYLDPLKEDEIDQAVDAVIAQIEALSAEITLADQSSVEAVRAAYDALSEAQKALVTNLTKLTEAEATLAELQAGDTTPPIITVKDLSDQTLSEELTVTEPELSFKVTAQDEKDGTLSPSVQLNGTALTAGSDGSYACTLTTGSNTISITATDVAGNQAEKSLSVTLGTSGTLTSSLSMNSDGNYTVSSVEDLNTMRSDIDKGINYAGKTIILTQDIDLSQVAVPLNSFTTQNTFSGCFDGNSHTISGYTDAKSGLFSLIDSNGYVKNLRIAGNVVINDASAVINNVYYDAATFGNKEYGLIANESWGSISRCSTTGTVTTNVPCNVGGTVGYNVLYTGVTVVSEGKLTDCFSNTVFNNQADSSVFFAGITMWAGDITENCYFYGQFIGNTLSKGQKLQIRLNGGSVPTCAYDSQMAVGCSGGGTSNGKKYTTAQMKDQASYTALGFDFDNCWSIDPNINDGYPYLDTLKGDNGADQAAADVVIAQIAALPATITLVDQNSVEAARTAYDALSEVQQVLVTNLAILTAAEATLAQLQPGDTTPPTITVKNSADQTLSEDLTVTESSFSFKVTAQDEKDGTISPSVQFNGMALTAGSDGTYACTLTTDSNTITITATDAAGNQAEKSLSVTLGTSGTLTPSLSKNSEGNYTVSSAADLNTLRSDIDKGIDYAGKIIVLTQDIDLSQAGLPLNSFTTQNLFEGCFDGKSHTISGYTDGKSGLFSLAGSDSYIRNLNLAANVVINDADAIIKDVTGNQGYGLIANESFGTISRCSTTGSVTNNVNCIVSGIVSYDYLTTYVNGKVVNSLGKIMNCFSNVVFNNQADSSSSPRLCGISFWPGASIEHCYFYGQFIGNTLSKTSKQPIVNMVGPYPGNSTAITCAYDYTVLGFYQVDNSKGVKYTTDQMKDQASYTALGFDFDKCWSMASAINNGYPSLDPLKEDKAATVKVRVDIQVTVADKTYDASLSEAENLNAVVTNVQIANSTPEIAAAIANYNVKLDYAVKSATLSSRMGEWPVKVAFDKLDLTYDPNDAYEFTINSVLPATAKYLENGQPGPTETEQAIQIELAKQAQDILYNSLQSGQGNVSAFTWQGDKANAPGKEGTIIFNNDPWGIFSPARSGYTGVRSGYYDDWFQSVQTGLQAMKDAGIGDQDVKMTEWEKLVLAISAIGYDPRDIKAYDLINIISNKTYQAASHQIMSQPYAGFALNSYNYPIPADGNRFDVDASIHQSAAYQISNQPTDPNASVDARAYDLAVMTIQPLFAYYNPNAKEGDPYYDVKVAVEYQLGIFSKAQTDLGYFYSASYLDNNPWNNAQVYIALGMAKVNPFDARYIKNGYSMFNGALSPYDFEKGTCPYKNDGGTYEPGQMGRGLDSLVRAYEGRNDIFDCTDVVDSTVPVNNAIAALPETITSANKAEVEAAQALYDALSEAKKASIQDVAKAKLAAAQLALGGETDQAAADVVIAQIEALPLAEAITLADQTNVQAARTAYDALSEAQMALVSNLAKLTAAEARILALGGLSDQAAADVVIAQIEALPLVEAITLADQGSVQAARTTYDALSEAQKALVTNLAKLTAAEARLAELYGGGDTMPPVITVKDAVDQTLSENLTVVEPGISFKVTAQDEKDGLLSPSVQLNGTALTAGSDGSYTCTLATGSNTLTITASDAAGNRAEKTLTITLGQASFSIERVGNESFQNGQQARLKVSVKNLTSASREAVFIVALYRTDGGNKMVNYAYVNKTIKAGEQEELGAGFPIPESGTYTIKGFVWDSLEDMKALMDEPVIVEVAQS